MRFCWSCSRNHTSTGGNIRRKSGRNAGGNGDGGGGDGDGVDNDDGEGGDDDDGSVRAIDLAMTAVGAKTCAEKGA